MSTVIFDGQGNMPELNRITAKKNYASSSQSHKMGATAMFNDILHYLAKEKYPSLLNEVEGNVAVRQHPVYAFEKIKIEGKENQYTRKFIGLFTVGPDKGDKGFFGFTNEAVKNKAIRLEGTDHIKGVGFNYPWEVNGVKNIRYNADKEALCIVTGSDATNWTAIFEQSYCGNKKTEADIEAYLEEKYRPAYEVAYYNNPLIVGVDKTIKEINSDIKAFSELRRTSDDRQYFFCEFWIDGEYDIYYLNKERNIYEKNGINILTDLGISEDDIAGLSIDEKNELFIQKRVERFKEECPKKFNKEDAIFQLMILFIMVASDNFEKNMYPYIMDLLWRFFQDDLDSIFSTDNQAQDTKKYSAELHDFTDDTHSAYVFKGEDSAFWQLIELAYPAECKKMGYDILQAMYDMASRGTTTTEKLMAFFEDYFFDRAQDYFTPSAYNNDTEYSYEEAWNNKEYVASVDIHPLAQALGGHEVTERAFLEKRIIFLMSKFGFGGFSSATDTALGVISFRSQTAQSFTLTPAIDMYPAILAGQAGIAASDHRVMAGEPVTLYPGAGGNTNTYIVGADWLSDIGDLKDFQIDPSSNTALTIGSKRLRRIKVGDENPEEVTSNLTTLSVQQCDSLESIDARNLKYLGGNEEEDVQGGITIDLTRCPRLIEALFGGTNVKEISIAPGSKIEKLQLPDSVTTIDLRNTKFLEDIEIDNLANVRFLRIEDVPALNGFAVLKEAYNSDGQQLKDIRLLNFYYDGDANDITMLANIALDKDKYNNSHSYNGIDPDGTPNSKNPDLQGTLNISGGVYEDDVNVVESLFNGLTIDYDKTKLYMRFADKEVLNVLLANMSGLPEGATGITTEQAAAVTSIGTWFKGNTAIQTFNEFKEFVNVKKIEASAFNGDTSLTSISIPESITHIYSNAFAGCTSLVIDSLYLPNLVNVDPNIFNGVSIREIRSLGKMTSVVRSWNTEQTWGKKDVLNKVVLNENQKALNAYAFYGYTALTEINLENVTTIGDSSFYNCTSLSSVIDISNVTVLNNSTFENCSSLETVLFSENITSIGNKCFNNCSKLAIDVNLPNLTTLSGSEMHFRNSGILSFTAPLLTEVKSSSFNSCKGLTYVKIGDKCTTVGGNGFQGCTSLKYVEFGTSIGTFSGSSFRGCTALETFIVKNPTPPSLASDAFASTNSAFIIYVPDASVEAYKGTTNWRPYANRILPYSDYVWQNTTTLACKDAEVQRICLEKYDKDGDGTLSKGDITSVTTIGSDFTNNTIIETFDEFELFTNVELLGGYGIASFYGCKNLKSIVLPLHIKEIPDQLFRDSGLVSVNLDNIEVIKTAAFMNADLSGLVLNLPRLKSMNGDSVFTNSNIKEITDLGTITELYSSGWNDGSFYGCKKLERVTIPRSLQKMCVSEFRECTSLSQVDLPNTLEQIGSQSFYGCTSLQAFICRASTPPSGITQDTFGNCPNLVIYVPDASVDSYRSAWSIYASRIKGISEYVEQ